MASQKIGLNGHNHQNVQTLLKTLEGINAGASLKVGKDLQLFEKWHECGDGEMTGERLAEIISCDPALLGQCP